MSAVMVASCGQQPQPSADSGAWAYSNDVDRMRDISTFTGCRTSVGPADTASGRTQVELCFQEKGGATHGWLELKDNGAVRCGAWPATCTVLARLDKGAPFELSMTEQAGVPGRLYMVDIRTLLARIGGADRLLVETPVDTRPPQDVAFSLDGLDFTRLQFPAEAFQPVADVQPPVAGAAPGAAPEAAAAAPQPAADVAPPFAVPEPPRKAARPKPARREAPPPDELGRDPVDTEHAAG